MHQHLIVVTFLEWLNWNDKGGLRVTPARLVWCDDGSAAAAVMNSLQFAPDLEPADDAFLIAEVCSPPGDARCGMLFLPLEGTKFTALSERSSRLLSPAARRMEIDLAPASEKIQSAWVRWKERYSRESADQQARRVWSWAWARVWPFDPHNPQEQILRKTQHTLAEMTQLLTENTRLREQIAGTSAEAWMHMALAAERDKLLASEDDAEWRRATRAYIASCVRSGRITASFFQETNVAFSDALATLPLDLREMVQLLAVAIGEHHALHWNAGQEPDLMALVADFGRLADLATKAGFDEPDIILSTALFALGRLLPGTAVVALQAKFDLPAGWVDQLLQENVVSDTSRCAILTEASQSLGLERSIATEHGPEVSGSTASAREIESATDVAADIQKQPVTITPDVSLALSENTEVDPAAEREVVGTRIAARKKGHSGTRRQGTRKPRANASLPSDDREPPEQEKLL